MNEELKAKIARLPKWAQRYIRNLEADMASLKAERGEVRNKESKIWFEVDHSAFVTEFHIPSRATICFTVERGVIEAELQDGMVRLHGSDTLVVLSEFTNALLVKIDK